MPNNQEEREDKMTYRRDVLIPFMKAKECSNILHNDCIEEVGKCYVCDGKELFDVNVHSSELKTKNCQICKDEE